MLPGSASKVLEAILPLVQTDPRIQHRWVAPKPLPRAAVESLEAPWFGALETQGF
jgi:hypothetical protein